MKIAITGATGFIGKHLVKHFADKRHEVLVIGRNKAKLDNAFPDKICKYESDYSADSLTKIFSGTDVVVHLAAKLLSRDSHPHKLSPFVQSNIITTENVFHAAEQNSVDKVCHTSSISVYSESNHSPLNEEIVPLPANIYGVSKLVCEHLANFFSLQTQLNITNLRLARLFGPGERESTVFMKYVSLAKEKKPLPVWGRGQTRVDYIYINDVVSAIDKAIQPGAPFGTFNIGSGRSYSVVEIAEAINEVFDNSGNIEFDGGKKERGVNVYMDNSKAKELYRSDPVQ